MKSCGSFEVLSRCFVDEEIWSKRKRKWRVDIAAYNILVTMTYLTFLVRVMLRLLAEEESVETLIDVEWECVGVAELNCGIQKP